jgi:hypothetical protein
MSGLPREGSELHWRNTRKLLWQPSTYSGHIVRAHFEALAVERIAEGPKVCHAVASAACFQPYLREYGVRACMERGGGCV